MAPKVSLPHR